MGQDIHFRCFLKSKDTGNYVNAHDLCEWDPSGTAFEDPVSGRNYDFFSLFGSSRGNYKEMEHANYGMPDFLIGSIFDKYCQTFGYYGFIWWKLPDLKLAVSEYIEKLSDPIKYLDKDDDRLANITELMQAGVKTETQQKELAETHVKWILDNKNILTRLYEFSCTLNRYELIKNSYTGLDNLVDIDETIFLFFFDS